MLDLIARLEATTGPDRELDHLIAKAVGAEYGPRSFVNIASRSYDEYDEIAKQYTSSLDAALRLKPANYWWECVQKCAPDSPMRSFGHGRMFVAKIGYFDAGSDYHIGAHDVPIIALCIAALKARHAISVTSNVRGGQE